MWKRGAVREMPQLILITCGETYTECPVSVCEGDKDRERERARRTEMSTELKDNQQSSVGACTAAACSSTCWRYIRKTIWSAMCCCTQMCFCGLRGVLVVREITLGYNSDRTKSKKKEIQHIIFKNSISVSKEVNPVIYQPILIPKYIILSFINC